MGGSWGRMQYKYIGSNNHTYLWRMRRITEYRNARMVQGDVYQFVQFEDAGCSVQVWVQDACRDLELPDWGWDVFPLCDDVPLLSDGFLLL